MEKFDLESFPTSESAKKMLGYVSAGFYDESYVGKWLFQVMGMEYDEVLDIVEDLPAQFFPETATWGLMYHEIKWGLSVRQNLSYEERRRLIYQKRDCRAPMTPYRMEKYLEDATGFEVHIADSHDPGGYGFVPPHPNVFKVYFIGEGSLDSKAVFEILNRLKQSHTTYTVNDRTEIELDNRSMEQFYFSRMGIHISVPFWACRILDGTWLLDGSVILGNRRRYGLVLGLRSNQGSFHTSEESRLASVRAGMVKVKNKEMLHARAEFRSGIHFWAARCLDGTWNLDGSELLDAELGKAKVGLTVRSDIDSSELETVADTAVETKSKDYWLMDGALPLDGTRNLNSIYRKEIVE